MKLVTSAEMARLDKKAQQQFHLPGLVLMENAAGAAYRAFDEQCLKGQRDLTVVFVAGSGNNGGDALVMARECTVNESHTTIVLLAKDTLGKDAALQAEIARAMGIAVVSWENQNDIARAALASADWIVDGLAGTGLSGELRDPAAVIARCINESPARVASVDAPSGVGDATPSGGECVCADVTLTLGLPKVCLYEPRHRPNCGQIILVPFCLPKQLTDTANVVAELLDEDPRALLPTLPRGAHKGERGRVSVFAGALGTSGAAVLASRTSLAGGAGLVKLIVPDDILVPVSAQLVSVMVSSESLAAGSETFGLESEDAVVVGPGWGTGADRSGLLEQIVGASRSGVIDADGLNVLSRGAEVALTPEWVLTPHPGELARLLGVTNGEVLADFTGSARAAALRYSCIVAAKACTTVIAEPGGGVAIVDGMIPELGTAGSGDVLSGLTGALLARGMDGYSAAKAACLAHRAAGQRLAASLGFFRSSQLIDEIAAVCGPGTMRAK